MTNKKNTDSGIDVNDTPKATFTPYPFPAINLNVTSSDFDEGGELGNIKRAHDVPDIELDDISILQHWLDNRHRPLRRTTLGEFGCQLPIGKWDGVKVDRSLTVTTSMNGKQRRKLAKAQTDEKKLSFDKLIRDVLGMCCPSILGVDLTKMHSGQIAATIGPMHMSDVVYAYVYLRRQIYGPTVTLSLTCDSCRSEYESHINLDNLEIDVVDDVSQLTCEYVLEHPVTWRNKPLTKVTLANTPFSSMARQDKRYSQHPDYIISYTLASSICGVNDREVALMSVGIEDLDDWDANDIDGASQLLGKHAAGPELAAETMCTECGNSQMAMFDANPLTFFRRDSSKRRY